MAEVELGAAVYVCGHSLMSFKTRVVNYSFIEEEKILLESYGSDTQNQNLVTWKFSSNLALFWTLI